MILLGVTTTPAVLQAMQPVTATQKQFAPVVINRLEVYQHPSGLFSLEVPAGWTFQDSSQPDEVINSWTDANINAVIVIDIFETEENLSSQELRQRLRELIGELFGSEPQFQIVDQSPQADGSVRVSWSYLVRVADGSGILQGRSLIEQRSNKIVILSIAYPEAQEAQLADVFNRIIASRRINTSVSVGQD
jgi:hypothetical protein